LRGKVFGREAGLCAGQPEFAMLVVSQVFDLLGEMPDVDAGPAALAERGSSLSRPFGCPEAGSR
jgi:hypothetical protein